MSAHTACQVVQSVKLFAGNNVGCCRKDLVFVDFVGLCGANKSKKIASHRRKVRGGVNSGNAQRNLLVLRKNWASSVKSVLDVERVNNASRRQSSDLKLKVGVDSLFICVCFLVVFPYKLISWSSDDSCGSACSRFYVQLIFIFLDFQNLELNSCGIYN